MDSINFNGYKIGRCKGLTKKGGDVVIDFYKLTKKDIKWSAAIKKLKDEKAASMATGAQSLIKEAEYDVFLAVAENKPIGIVAGKEKLPEKNLLNPYYIIAYFGAWGKDKKLFSLTRKNKVKNTGQGLLNLMFKTAKNKGLNRIELSSKQEAVKFYKERGFVFNERMKGKTIFHSTNKELKRNFTPQEIEKEFSEVDMKFINSKKDIDMNFLDTSFDSSLFKDYVIKIIDNIKQKLG